MKRNYSRKGIPLMGNTQLADTFFNTRIPTSLKEQLKSAAAKQGVTPSQFLVQLLDRKFTSEPDQVGMKVQAEDLAEGWENLLGQVVQLNEQRDRLAEIIRSKQGLFSDAPKSLKIALKVCDQRIAEVQGELEKMLPKPTEKSKGFFEEFFEMSGL